MGTFFQRFAEKASAWLGRPLAFFAAVILVAAWAISGPLFHYSTTWQLVINTGTTIITFLMVFLIQNTQNRENRALHLKIDELLHALHEARDDLIDIEHDSDQQLDELQKEFRAFRTEPPGRRGDAASKIQEE